MAFVQATRQRGKECCRGLYLRDQKIPTVTEAFRPLTSALIPSSPSPFPPPRCQHRPSCGSRHSHGHLDGVLLENRAVRNVVMIASSLDGVKVEFRVEHVPLFFPQEPWTFRSLRISPLAFPSPFSWTGTACLCVEGRGYKVS